jgi:hypothetical protein
MIRHHYPELLELHQTCPVMMLHICVDEVIVEMSDLHEASLLNKKEFLAFCPSVACCVCEDTGVQEPAVLFVLLATYGFTAMGVLRIIQEVVIVLVLLSNTLAQQLIQLLQVGEGVHVSVLLALWVIQHLVVVQLAIARQYNLVLLELGLALEHQVGQHVFGLFFPHSSTLDYNRR